MACYRNSNFHRSAQTQRGRGVGNVLRSLYSNVTPVLKSVGSKILTSPMTKAAANVVKDIAVNAGLNVFKETLRGDNLSKSLDNNLSAAKRKLSKALVKQLYKQVGRGKKKRSSSGEKIAAKRQKLNFLFDDDSVQID